MATAKELALQALIKLENMGIFVNLGGVFSTDRLATITLAKEERHALPKLCAERGYYFHDDVKDGKVMVAFRPA